MNGRLVGAALLVSTVVATLGLAAILRIDNQGEATPSPVPNAPTVGMCAETKIEFPNKSGSFTDSFANVLGNPFGACSPTSTGEVVGMIDAAHDAEEVDVKCGIAMNTYLGLPETGIIGSWRPEHPFKVLAIGPTDRQRAAGDIWTACVLVLLVWGPPDAPASIANYRHTARNSFGGMASDDRFGVCTGDDARWTPCDRPHPIQLFGETAELSTDTSLSKLTLGCRNPVAHLSVAPDPTFNGRLEIFIAVAGAASDDQAGAGPGPDPVYACGVKAVAGENLIGSLLGIGELQPRWGS